MKSKLFKFSFGFLFLLVAFLTVSYCLVSFNAKGRTFDDVNRIPHNKYGLLLATSPFAPSGRRNLYFDDRVKAAVKLFKSGKIDYVIASGGDYRKAGQYGFNEPQALHDSLVKYGVPSERILLDYEGQRTIFSIQNIRSKYKLDSVTLISQPFHNERALFLARHLGVNAIAFNADERVRGRIALKNYIREIFARPKMFLDIIAPQRK